MRHSWLYLCVCFVILGPPTACTSFQSSIEDGRSSDQKLQRIEHGMSPDEVRAIMGTPADTIRTNGGIEWLVYGNGPYHFRIFFQDNRVAAAPRRMMSAQYGGTP